MASDDARNAAFDLMFANREAHAVERLSEAAARCLSASAGSLEEVACWDAVADEASAEQQRLMGEDRVAREVLGLV